MTIVTESHLASLETDGVVCIRQAFDPAWIQSLAIGMQKAFASPGRHFHATQEPGTDRGLITDRNTWSRVTEIRDFAFRSPAAGMAASLLRSQRINFLYDGVWMKTPGTSLPTEWHQDQPYLYVNGQQVCIFWIPIDPVDALGSLRFIRGSHRWNRQFLPRWTSESGEQMSDELSGYEPQPDFDSAEYASQTAAWKMEPGDCMVFFARTVHGAKGNPRLDRARRAFSMTWLGDDTVYQRRPWPGLIDTDHFGLRNGDSMDCLHCPRVWPPNVTRNAVG